MDNISINYKRGRIGDVDGTAATHTRSLQESVHRNERWKERRERKIASYRKEVLDINPNAHLDTFVPDSSLPSAGSTSVSKIPTEGESVPRLPCADFLEALVRRGWTTESSDGVHAKPQRPTYSDERVIICIDLDYFYAQVHEVEERDDNLAEKPLGVQQKYIIVTCNYVARSRGIHKLMDIEVAKKKCPDLVLRNGENLNRYRWANTKIRDVLKAEIDRVTTCCNMESESQPIEIALEKSGFDEFYIDVTAVIDAIERVGAGLRDSLQLCESLAAEGCAVIGNEGSGDVVDAAVVQSLVESTKNARRWIYGAALALQFRRNIHSVLGYTSSGGISCNKLLAKLAVNHRKPAGQTIFPPSPAVVSTHLSPLRTSYLQGVGSALRTKLFAGFGAKWVYQLLQLSEEEVAMYLGEKVAAFVYDVCRGIDRRPVVHSGLAKTISVEDSMQHCQRFDMIDSYLRNLSGDLLLRLQEEFHEYQRVPLVWFAKWRNSREKNGKRSGHLENVRCSVEMISNFIALFKKQAETSATPERELEDRFAKCKAELFSFAQQKFHKYLGKSTNPNSENVQLFDGNLTMIGIGFADFMDIANYEKQISSQTSIRTFFPDREKKSVCLPSTIAAEVSAIGKENAGSEMAASKQQKGNPRANNHLRILEAFIARKDTSFDRQLQTQNSHCSKSPSRSFAPLSITSCSAETNGSQKTYAIAKSLITQINRGLITSHRTNGGGTEPPSIFPSTNAVQSASQPPSQTADLQLHSTRVAATPSRSESRENWRKMLTTSESEIPSTHVRCPVCSLAVAKHRINIHLDVECQSPNS